MPNVHAQPGEVVTVPYPFIRATRTNEDGIEVDTWNPGCRFETVTTQYTEYVESFADGMGELSLWVISVHRPGTFPTRIFFTRQWRTPEGKLFGKGGLHMATLAKFRRLAAGYQHPFELAAVGA